MDKFFDRFNFTKIVRVKQIEDNKGKTIVSEGIDALPRHDQLCCFAMILMNSKSYHTTLL
jgi:hypothetical protein